MADAETETEDAAPEASGGGWKKRVLMGVAGIVLLGGGIALGPIVTSLLSSEPGEEEEEEVAVADEEPTGPALYQSLLPPLIINIMDADGDAHFMQMSLDVMSHDQEVVNAIRDHTPAIRNSLILLYSGATYEDVTTREGKEQLLDDGLAEIRKLMRPHIGNGRIEGLYFTALVVQ